MSRALRRITASVATFLLALGGVALGAAPAHAAIYVPTSTGSIPTSVTWGDVITVDGTFAALPGATALDNPSFRWWRVSDGAQLSNRGSYVVDIADIGTQIYGTVSGVIVGGTYAGYSTTVYSNWTGAVAKKSFDEPTLTASGDAVAGGVLTVGGSGWGATPASFDWEWRRVSDNAVVASGAGTAAPGTYTVTSADVAAGSIFYAIVTAHLAGYGDATWATSYSQAAHLATFAEPSLSVGGVATAGSPLTVQVDSGWGAIPSSYDWEWRRVSDNALVAGGSGPTIGSYTVSSADVAARSEFYAIVTAHLADYASATWPTSFSQPAHPTPFVPGAGPVITGRNVLGGTLTASVDPSAWAPTPTSFSYAWFLQDGTPIPGADEATLEMTADLVGEVVYVVATAHATDHVDHVIASAPTGRIAEPQLGTGSGGTVRAGGSVTVTAWGLLLDEDYTVELHSAPVVLGSATSGLDGTISKTFTIPAGTPGGAHTLVLLHDGVQVATLALTVQAAPAAIAATGADADLTVMTLIAALTFLAAGVVLVVSRRVASRRSSTD